MASLLQKHELLCAAGGVVIGAAAYAIARSTQSALSARKARGKKMAVILAGCGVFDGSEIHESVAVLVHAQRKGAEVTFFAPNIVQHHHILHTTGAPVLAPPLSQRNVLEESARIARGQVSDIRTLDPCEFDYLVIPGGFGVAKNLCTFALETDFTVNPEVERVVHGFHEAGKPIAMCCIAPVLAAKLLTNCTITVGSSEKSDRWPYAATAGAVEKLGATHVERDVSGVCVDVRNKLVTSPAYMCNASALEVFNGIGGMIDTLVQVR